MITEYTAVVSVVIGLIVLYYTRKNYSRQTKEDLEIVGFRLSEKPYPIAWSIRSQQDPKQRLYLVTEWECTVINNSSIPTSVVRWEIQDQGKIEILPIEGALYKIKKAGVNDPEKFFLIKESLHQLYFVEPDERIDLPLTIAPAASVSFKIKLAFYIDREIQEIIQEELNSDRIGDDTQEILRFLREKRLPLKKPIVAHAVPLRFKTSKGKWFVAVSFFSPSGELVFESVE